MAYARSKLRILATLLAVGCAAGCSAGHSGFAEGFRTGTYDHCTAVSILGTPGGGGNTNNGGTITLTQSGSVVSVSYGGDGGALTTSLDFTQASAASATLNGGQDVDGISVVCAPTDSAPAVTQLASGSLTYNDGTLFLSALGTAEPFDSGGGCSNPGGPASLFITCTDDASPQGGSVVSSPASADLASDFVGVYSCTSSEQNLSAGVDSVAGAMGTLTIASRDGTLTADYTNDWAIEGTLTFAPVTASAAVPTTADQTMQVYCFGDATPNGSTSLTSLPVTSSTLTLDGSSAILSFFGTTSAGSPCPGAATTATVLCTK